MESNEFSTTRSSSAAICPVPVDQQPLHQYQELLDSGFFSWGPLALPQYLWKAFWCWGVAWVVTGPVSAASFAPAKHPIAFGAVAGLAALVPVLLSFVRLYVGWSHVHRRLSSEKISYEESGWYDGQTWTKPLEVRAQDLLVVNYQVKPVLQRIQWSLGITLALLLVGSVCVGWTL